MTYLEMSSMIEKSVRLYVGNRESGALAWTWCNTLLGGDAAIVLSVDLWNNNTFQFKVMREQN